MSEQLDFFGGGAPPGARYRTAPFRESVSTTKAELAHRLNTLLRKAPPAGAIDTVDKARAYRQAHAEVLKVAINTRSSVANLTSAISRIAAWHGVTRHCA